LTLFQLVVIIEPYVVIHGNTGDLEEAINLVAAKGYRLVAAYGGGWDSYDIDGLRGSHYAVMENTLLNTKVDLSTAGSRKLRVF
jgi:hypothetical protein